MQADLMAQCVFPRRSTLGIDVSAVENSFAVSSSIAHPSKTATAHSQVSVGRDAQESTSVPRPSVARQFSPWSPCSLELALASMPPTPPAPGREYRRRSRLEQSENFSAHGRSGTVGSFPHERPAKRVCVRAASDPTTSSSHMYSTSNSSSGTPSVFSPSRPSAAQQDYMHVHNAEIGTDSAAIVRGVTLSRVPRDAMTAAACANSLAATVLGTPRLVLPGHVPAACGTSVDRGCVVQSTGSVVGARAVPDVDANPKAMQTPIRRPHSTARARKSKGDGMEQTHCSSSLSPLATASTSSSILGSQEEADFTFGGPSPALSSTWLSSGIRALDGWGSVGDCGYGDGDDACDEHATRSLIFGGCSCLCS